MSVREDERSVLADALESVGPDTPRSVLIVLVKSAGAWLKYNEPDEISAPHRAIAVRLGEVAVALGVVRLSHEFTVEDMLAAIAKLKQRRRQRQVLDAAVDRVRKAAKR